MKREHVLSECRLCPRQCGVNRLQGYLGFCGETAQLRVASIEAHFGEEPPISGTCGSGTVFFSGCTLQCLFCQNYQISRQHLGEPMSVEEVVRQLRELHAARQIHNVNFVTPDHCFPQTIDIVAGLRENGMMLPIVYNLSGYERKESLRLVRDTADIYLPDFKYADKQLARQLSHCEDYPTAALDAVAEMLSQKSILDLFSSDDGQEIARQGVLVRHLILPGQVQNSIDALSMLFLEFGKTLPLSLMSQYHPVQSCGVPGFQRRITNEEFQQVYDHVLELGFQHLFVQFPEEHNVQELEFLPDFRNAQPFKGNMT